MCIHPFAIWQPWSQIVEKGDGLNFGVGWKKTFFWPSWDGEYFPRRNSETQLNERPGLWAKFCPEGWWWLYFCEWQTGTFAGVAGYIVQLWVARMRQRFCTASTFQISDNLLKTENIFCGGRWIGIGWTRSTAPRTPLGSGRIRVRPPTCTRINAAHLAVMPRTMGIGWELV